MESKSESISSNIIISDDDDDDVSPDPRVGLIYDERMCKHFHSEDHPENPNRIRAIWNKLQSSGITQRCVILDAKEAEDKHIALVHSKNHTKLIKSISSKKSDSRRNSIAEKYDSIYFNKGSSEAAYLAVGSVIEVVEKVAKGELNSAFAIVRPPGHHAEINQPMGFCLHNNVAIATSFLLNERKDLGIKKILIVDWDVHHGNGTQQMFWKDPRVLLFSVHRHDNGNFYPSGNDGSYIMIGEGPGKGYNINVPWPKGGCGDADYLAVWDHILIPVTKEFNPDLIIVSAGFDAAAGDPLGGCLVSPYGYSIMLEKLKEFANGKIVMALEGGYNLDALADSVLSCIQVLLNEGPVSRSLETCPLKSTWRVIRLIREKLKEFWPILGEKLPKNIAKSYTPQLRVKIGLQCKTFESQLFLSGYSSSSDLPSSRENMMIEWKPNMDEIKPKKRRHLVKGDESCVVANSSLNNPSSLHLVIEGDNGDITNNNQFLYDTLVEILESNKRIEAKLGLIEKRLDAIEKRFKDVR